jgi:threonyl-tRNA synthetase
VILALGKREMTESTVSIRRLGSQEQTVLPLAQAVAVLQTENR